MSNHLEIPITGKANDTKLMVYPQSSKAKFFEENDLSSGESRWQLVEGEVVFHPVCPKSADFRDAVQS